MKIVAIDIDGVLTETKFDFKSSRDQILRIPIEKDSKEALQELNHNYHINIVTSRPRAFSIPTVQWVNRNFGYKNVIFVNPKTPQNTHSDILIDDRVENIQKFIAEGGSGILFLRSWSLGGQNLGDFLKNIPEELRKAGVEKKFFVANGWKGVLDVVNKVVV